MLESVKKWFAPTLTPFDTEKISTEKNINVILNYVFVVILFFGIIFIPIYAKHKIESWGVTLAGVILVVIIRQLIRYGFVKQAGFSLVFGVWFFFIGISITSGGISSPFMIVIILFSVVFDIFIPNRWGNILIFMSLLASLAIAIFEQFGVSFPTLFTYSPLMMWFFFAAALIFTNRTKNYFIGLLQSNKKQIQDKNTALEDALVTLRASESKYLGLHESMQDGYAFVDLDGRFIETNETFRKMVNYEPSELENLTNLDLTPENWYTVEKEIIQKQVLEKGLSDIYEKEYRKKDGKTFPVELRTFLSKDPNGNKLGMWSLVRDVSIRKHTEEILNARVRISEFAFKNSLEKLLQFSLDELCALTKSPIGFFHFVAADQKTLHLQAWSTRTLNEMCSADGRGSHYNIENAGVWADSARLGKPIIHNNYEGLTNKHGLPKGHATIVREMVFPIFRDQKIVAIIGIGNKALDYDESDLAFASELADMIWDITERKRAEEAELKERMLADALRISASALNSSLNLENVLDRILESVGHVVSQDAVAVFFLTSENKIAQVAACNSTGYENINKKGQQYFVSQTRNFQEMLSTHSSVIISDTREYDGWVSLTGKGWIRSVLGVPINFNEEVIGFLNLYSSKPNMYTHYDGERLKAFSDQAAIAMENARLYEKVQRLALIDALTGAYNRAFFETELARMQVGRNFPISILIADLDNMKITNDTFGHTAGDELLKNTAKFLKMTFREEDIVARIGGDEFAILLPNTDEQTSVEMLNRIRGKLNEYNKKPLTYPINLSIGVATANKGHLSEAFRLADKHMYAEKTSKKVENDQLHTL